jgi:hypothetical protein
MNSLRTPRDSSARVNDLTWSRSEKAVARTAFDAALNRELRELMDQAKQMASQISEPSDLWERHKEIDRKYDYRYSQLTDVLGRLWHESRITEEELSGLREDKLRLIRSFAKYLSGMNAA